MDVAVVIVGSDLRIRRFTPTAERLLNLIPADIGRPLGQIKTTLIDADLEALAHDTIELLQPIERDVQGRDERWYALAVRPYRNVDQRIDGAVITLMDVTATKGYQQQVDRLREHLLANVATMREPAFVLDEQLHVKLANHALVERLGLDGVTDSTPIERFGRSRWNLEPVRRMLGAQHAGTDTVTTPPIDLRVPNQTPTRVTLTARRVALEAGRMWTQIVMRETADAP